MMIETGTETRGMVGTAIALLDPGLMSRNTIGTVRRISTKVRNSKWHCTASNRSQFTF